MNRGLRTALIATLLVVAALGLMTALLLHETPRPVETAGIDRGTVRATVEVESRTRLRQEYMISAPVAGVLQRVELEAGDRVGKGEVLARIEPVMPTPLDARTRRQREADYRAAQDQVRAATADLSAARAQAAQREADYRHLERLTTEKHVSESDLQQAETAWREATDTLHAREAQLGLAKSQAASLKALLEDYDSGNARALAIRAPIDGVVLQRELQSSQTVNAGQPILRLGDLRSMEVAIDALTQTAAQVHPGTPVDFLRWGGEPLHGKVRRIEPDGYTKFSALGVEEQHVWVLADVPQWPEELGVGYRLDAQLELARKDDVPRVPNSATFRTRGGAWQVFIMKDYRAVLRKVQLGLQGDDYSELLGGLEPGDTIIIHPDTDLEDGTAVEPAFNKGTGAGRE
jgi:HlyD family secretion protein